MPSPESPAAFDGSMEEVVMGRPAGWMKELTGRGPLMSPGAPSLRRDVERAFWRIGGCQQRGRGAGGRGLPSGWQPMVQSVAAWRRSCPTDLVPVLVL